MVASVRRVFARGTLRGAFCVAAVRFTLLLESVKEPLTKQLCGVLPLGSGVFVHLSEGVSLPCGIPGTRVWRRAVVTVALAEPLFANEVPGLVAMLVYAIRAGGYLLATHALPVSQGSTENVGLWLQESLVEGDLGDISALIFQTCWRCWGGGEQEFVLTDEDKEVDSLLWSRSIRDVYILTQVQ